MAAAVVTSLYRYPVKSVGGTAIDRVHVEATGLCGDRLFAFVDVESGSPCNAKNPRKYGRMLLCTAYYPDEPVPGAPLPPVHVRFPDGRVGRQGDDLDDLMSGFLGRRVQLIDTVPEKLTAEFTWDETSGVEKSGPYANAVQNSDGDYVSTVVLTRRSSRFVDLTPLHIVSMSSVRHFQELAPGANFDARRYRPSFVVETPAAGASEEAWVGGSLQAPGGLRAEVVMVTPRCVMSTLEHAPDVPLDRTTLRTLARHNTQDIPGFGRGACLGVYADVAQEGALSVGDALEFRAGSPQEVEERAARYESSSHRRQREARELQQRAAGEVQ